VQEERSGFAATLREIGHERERALSGHPDPERLAAYGRGALSEAEEVAVQEHLALCRDCADLVLDLPLFAGEGAAPDEPGETEAGWEDLRERLGWGAPARDAAARRRERPSVFGPGGRAYLAAASAALAAGAALIWGMGQRADLKRLREPRANVRVVDVEDPGAIREVSQQPPVVELSRDSPQAVLLLYPQVRRPAGSLSARILDAAGRPRWEGRGFEPNENGAYSLTLTRGFLPAGSYVVELVGGQGAEESLVGRFPIEIVER
jgi:hypothetical protein